MYNALIRFLSVFASAVVFAFGVGDVRAAERGPAEHLERVIFQEALVQESLDSGLSARDSITSQVVAEEFSRQISNVEWLAPLAPVALSPFFGIALLSGLACYGPEWLPDSNALLSEGSPLANPMLFWIFLVLTVVTSLPRFSKVSKPVIQLADFLETYSAIVILAALKFVSMQESETAAVAMVVGEQAGILSMGWEGLIALAMAVNIVVINTVKFFFEILVWITPIPFLDACFEAANKSLCAGLMAIYAFSPIVALVINLLLFVLCSLVFVWIRRREIFYRTILVDWLTGLVSKSRPDLPERLIVFPKSEFGSIPARAKCLLEKKADGGWTLTQNRFLRGPVAESFAGSLRCDSGWWTNSIVLEDQRQLTFSTRYSDQLEELAKRFGMEIQKMESAVDRETSRQIEFA